MSSSTTPSLVQQGPDFLHTKFTAAPSCEQLSFAQLVSSALSAQSAEGKTARIAGSVFPLNYSPCLFTNEQYTHDTRQILAEQVSTEGLYVGVSGLENYTLAFHSKASHILLIDIDKRVHDFHMLIIEKLQEGNLNRKEFLVWLKEKLQQTAYPQEFIAQLKDQLGDSENARDSWLGNDEIFDSVRKLAQQDRIVTTVMDIADTEKWESFGEKLKKINLCCNAIYISNVAEYRTDCFMNNERLAAKTLGILSDNTLIVASTREKFPPRNLVQVVYKARHYGEDVCLTQLHSKS